LFDEPPLLIEEPASAVNGVVSKWLDRAAAHTMFPPLAEASPSPTLSERAVQNGFHPFHAPLQLWEHDRPRASPEAEGAAKGWNDTALKNVAREVKDAAWDAQDAAWDAQDAAWDAQDAAWEAQDIAGYALLKAEDSLEIVYSAVRKLLRNNRL
jgi:hypothetical protein